MSMDTGRIEVIVENVEPEGGAVHIALHNKDNFLNSRPPLTGLIRAPNGAEQVKGALQPMPYGTYAVAVYQDRNGNGKLDKNALGIPTEPYAFSNNPTVKWKPPSFSEAAVALNAPKVTVSVRLRYWKEY